jgi:hypothetical protein
MRILAGDASYMSLRGQFGKKKGGKAGVGGGEILKIKYAKDALHKSSLLG